MALEDSGSGRVIGALVAPGKTFRSIAERPTWVAPLVVLLVISTLLGVLMNGKIDPNEMRQQVQQRIEKSQGQATPEQIDRGVEIGRKFGAVIVWLVPVFGTVVYLLLAAIFLGAFRFFSGSNLTFKQSFATLLHAYLPGVVAALLAVPLVINRTSISMKEAQGGGILASN